MLSPTAELSALVNVLFGIEERAKLYYINSSSSGGDTPTPEPEPTPVTPEPTPSGGGSGDE